MKVISTNSCLPLPALISMPENVLTHIFKYVVSAEHKADDLAFICKKFFVLTKMVQSIDNQNYFFLKACEHGCYFSVKIWMENKEKLDLSVRGNQPLQLICAAKFKRERMNENDYCKILDLFLEHSKIDSTIDPTAQHDFCIRIACANRNLQIVQRLLTDGRCNPSRPDDFCLRVACANGDSQIVQSLLADGRCDPFNKQPLAINDKQIDSKSALEWACLKGYEDIVYDLLKNTEVFLEADEEKLYQEYCDQYIELKDFIGKTSAEPNKYQGALIAACRNKHSKIVSRLLRHSAVDPSKMQDALLNIANLDRSIIRLLVVDGRLDYLTDSEKYAYFENPYLHQHITR